MKFDFRASEFIASFQDTMMGKQQEDSSMPILLLFTGEKHTYIVLHTSMGRLLKTLTTEVNTHKCHSLQSNCRAPASTQMPFPPQSFKSENSRNTIKM